MTLTPVLKSSRACEWALKSNSRGTTWLYVSLILCPQPSELISLCLSFLPCKRGPIITKQCEEEMSTNQQHAERPHGPSLHRHCLGVSTRGAGHLALGLHVEEQKEARVAGPATAKGQSWNRRRDRLGWGLPMGSRCGEQERPEKWVSS